MTDTTYDVRVWKTDKYVGEKRTTYRVRWSVAGRPRSARFPTAALAESFRAELITASRRGEAFDVDTGRPISETRDAPTSVLWYDFACSYVDMKWPAVSPKHRKGIAEALVTVTCVLVDRELPDGHAPAVRSALLNWGFNHRRGSAAQPEHVTAHLAWVAKHSRPLADLERPEVLRAVLDAVSIRLDGRRAAGRTATWKRSILSTALAHAVEMGHLDANPVAALKWTAPRSVQTVDRRVVANPAQAKALLLEVGNTTRSGPALVAFFGAMYYAALRPEEAANLNQRNLDVPASGWGWLILEKAAPEVDSQWSDTGHRRESRELKHRAVGETRRVPCPAPLTGLLQRHLAQHGTANDGRLFRGERDAPLGGATYRRLWARARAQALTPAQVASPLARRPYDLRHAAVSTWLNGGVPPTQVAEWAGHSVAVLLKVYARCLDGQEDAALRRIHAALDLDEDVSVDTD